MSVDGTLSDATGDVVKQKIATGTTSGSTSIDLDAEGIDLLTNAFHFHPLAVEDAEHFGQRPKIEDYDDFFYLVVHGAVADGGGTVEVHCFYSEKFLVTIERGGAPPFDDRPHPGLRCADRAGGSTIMLLYRIIDALIDSFFPVLAASTTRSTTWRTPSWSSRPRSSWAPSSHEAAPGRPCARSITPQRGHVRQPGRRRLELPGHDPRRRALLPRPLRPSHPDQRPGRQLPRPARGAMDTHLSTVSNRLNVVMKQLTIIATIFLPLSFLTGFFGQNFGWMVGHIGGVGNLRGPRHRPADRGGPRPARHVPPPRLAVSAAAPDLRLPPPRRRPRRTFTGLLAEFRPRTPASISSTPPSHRRPPAGGVDDDLRRRIAGHLPELTDGGARRMICTCSTLGAAAEDIGRTSGLDVVRVDRPMAERAVDTGGRIAIVAALESTMAPTRALLAATAGVARRDVELVDAPCLEAWAHFEAGDHRRYLATVAAHVTGLDDVDVIVLAQASMAPVEDLVDVTPLVLSSPRTTSGRSAGRH